LKLMLRKFERRATLDDADRQALLDLPHRLQTVEPASYILREGDRPDRACLILGGFAFRHKVTVEGARQIVSVHIPGDFVDLEAACSTSPTTMSRRSPAASWPSSARRDARSVPRPSRRSPWRCGIDTLIDGSVFREWVVNVGRRDAPLAHRPPALRVRAAAGGGGPRRTSIATSCR
jgi:hypothetical protein